MAVTRQDNAAGLCVRCHWVKEIRSDRGSIFLQCLRHKEDPAYPKYPRLPVLTCCGFEPRASG